MQDGRMVILTPLFVARLERAIGKSDQALADLIGEDARTARGVKDGTVPVAVHVAVGLWGIATSVDSDGGFRPGIAA